MRSLFTTKFALKEPGDSGNAWNKEELQDFLSDVVMSSAEPSNLCFFIDALDEGEQEADVRQMISFLVDLSEQALGPDSSCQLRICLSSRHYPHIKIQKGLSLVVEEQPEHGKDIYKYIRNKLTGLEGEEKDELSVEIYRKSASVFLWVVLVMEMLNTTADRGCRLTDIRAHLDTIPENLNELFKEILAKGVHDIETSVIFLQWALFSMRALRPEELYLAIEHSRTLDNATPLASRELKAPSTERLTKYILDCSCGLVELTSTHPPVVQFIHETVREFLISENGLSSLLPVLSTNLQGLSHEILKVGCFRYISANEIPKDVECYITEGHYNNSSYEYRKAKLHRELPFIDYATSFAFIHAEYAQRHAASQEIFLKSKIDADGTWQGSDRLWRNLFERFKARKYASNVTLLYFLAEQGHLSLLSTLLKVSNTVNAQCGRYGCALHAACVTGNEQVVRWLIANGANMNAQGREYKHPLLAAIMSKNFTLVPILQRYGARLDPKLLQKAFFTMIARQSPPSVAKLLELGAEVNGVNDRKETPLDMALERYSWVRKNKGTVELILRHGGDLGAQREKYGNTLQVASYCGCDNVVQMLLDQGAEVNAQGGKYGNALQAASRFGNENIVQMLVNWGADVNAQGGEFGNALQAASCGGRDKVVQMLLDQGVDVNVQGGVFGNALQAASYNDNGSVVQILLDRGADVNAQGGEYGSALQAASYNGNEWVAEILLELGADVNAQGGEYGNALQAAAASHLGSRGIVRILLDWGADVNAQGGKYGSALQAASYNGNKWVAEILLELGADLNAQGGEYGNALQAAAASHNGSRWVVQILLDWGADVNAQGGKYGSALQAASYRGDEKAVQILLDRGADVNAQGGMYGNALQAASYHDNDSVVQILLDWGVDVNTGGD